MWRVEVAENPDWGYARNLQLVLKTHLAEYSSSVFSVPLEAGGLRYYGGNRDYSWQGLIVGPIDGVLYKTLDGLFYSTGSQLAARHVWYQPGEFSYGYEDPAGQAFVVRIALDDLQGRIFLRAAANKPCWFAVPLDLRPAERWTEASYAVRWLEGSVVIQSDAAPVTVTMRGFSARQDLNMSLNWRYKLGDGFREIRDGLVAFSEHRRPIHLPFALYCPNGLLEVQVDAEPRLPTNLPRAESRAAVRLGTGRVAQALRLRIENLGTFGIPVAGTWFPEAGAWWFRKPWIRDAIEGLRWNIRTYVEILGRSGPVGSLVLGLLDLLESRGGLPIIYGEGGCFSSDAPPLLLTVACELARLGQSRNLALRAVDVARHVCENLLAGKSVSGSVLADSVICCPASSSWLDSVISLGGIRWPTRIPRSWAAEGLDPRSSEFGLVEVNALYIESLGRVLECAAEMGLGVSAVLEQVAGELVHGFKARFRRQDSLPFLTIVPSHGLADPTPGSPALVSLACLKDSIYTRNELSRLWNQARTDLLVERTPMVLGGGRLPFGVLVRAGERRPYLGDEEYHGPTVWPRDTPYLIRLLEATGGDVRGILLNNLDHMIAEGAFGYCSELFSLPVGCAAGGMSDNPVPVKNPAQYWSHWCDPYLDHLRDLGLRSLGREKAVERNAVQAD